MKEVMPPTYNKKDSIIGKISSFLNIVAGLSMLGVAIITVYEIVMRKIFNQPTEWVFSISLFVMMWYALLAASQAFKERKHIAVDMALILLSNKTRAYLEVLTYFISLIFVIALTYFGTYYCINAYSQKIVSTDMLMYPVWILYLIFPVSGTIMVLQIMEILFSSFSSAMELNKKYKKDRTAPWLAVVIFLMLVLVAVLFIKLSVIAGLLILIVTLLFAGIPVSFALGLTGISGMIAIFNNIDSLHMVPVIMERTLHNFILLAIPMFIMGGVILFRCGVGERTYDLANKIVNNLPGGLAVGTILACAIFSAMVGVSTAVAAAIGLTAIPMLISHGYSKEMAYGSVAGGALGILIPPSAGLIVYGFLTNSSVGVLFAASFVPAMIVVALFSIYAVFYCKFTGNYKKISVTWKERAVSFKRGALGVSAPVVMLGGIYTGIFTPTEAAGILVVYSLLVGLFYKELSWRKLFEILKEGATYGSVILMVMVGAMLFADVIGHLRVPRIITEWMVSSGISVITAKLGIVLLYIILGMFLDGLSLTVLTIPVLFPMMVALDINVIAFGVTLSIFVEMALLTPPVGLNLFMIKTITGDSLVPIIKGNFPFAIMLMMSAILLLMFPEIALWLPKVLGLM